MIRKHKLIISIVIIIGIMLIYLLTYIPHKIVNIDCTEVSKIEIFDGEQGKEITITNNNEIEHIISNLNNIKLQKGKCSIGYMGYRFNITIYKKNGKKYKELIINSNDTIRYKGFFYKDNLGNIDYDYLDNLFIKDEEMSNMSIDKEYEIRGNVKAYIDNLDGYDVVNIEHLTKGIEEVKIYEPEYPKPFKAGKFKVLFKKGENEKIIICQTEEKVGHIAEIMPGKTVIDGCILFYDSNNYNENEDLKGISSEMIFNKEEEKYFIKQLYKKFTKEMTENEAYILNRVKDCSIAIYLNGQGDAGEFHTEQKDLIKEVLGEK